MKVGRSVEKIRFIFSGGKKALAQKEQKKAKEEKRQRLTNQRFIRAVECAKAKGGDCRTMDNVRIVCKLCREKESANLSVLHAPMSSNRDRCCLNLPPIKELPA